jgi:hypothetical protein
MPFKRQPRELASAIAELTNPNQFDKPVSTLTLMSLKSELPTMFPHAKKVCLPRGLTTRSACL